MMDPQFTVKLDHESGNYSRFVIEPLEQGYGHTLGNSLRRVLLTSIKGAAITSVKIEGVQHQFSTFPGLKEDIVEFLLNLKKVRLHMDVDGPVTLTLLKKGEGAVQAGDIEVASGVKVVNPELYLGTLSGSKTKLDIEMTAATGYGYESADQRKSDVIGMLPIDSLFSPVMRVNYKVEQTRVGRMTNLDKLIMEIWSDGSVSAQDMLSQSAKMLVSYFVQVYEPKVQSAEKVVAAPSISDDVLKMKIEELDIPTRIVNALANGKIETVGQLLATPKDELMQLKNLGSKSLSIISEKLQEKGVSFSV